MAAVLSAVYGALTGVLSAGERAAGRLPAGAVLFLFCAVNCLSFVDRGVIPGAFDALGQWVQRGMNVTTADAYIGYLQSAFIVGYSVASLAMGHLVHVAPPFKLMAGGLAVWVLSSLACAAAPNFWLLLIARMVSGVGEWPARRAARPLRLARARARASTAALFIFARRRGVLPVHCAAVY